MDYSCVFSLSDMNFHKFATNKLGQQYRLCHTHDSPPKIGGRRGMKASVATTGDLSPPRSAEGFSPRRGGGGAIIELPPPLKELLYEAKASVVATNARSRWPPT